MIGGVKAWLKSHIEAAGVERVFVDAEDLVRNHAIPYAVLVVDKEKLERDGSRVGRADDEEHTTRTIRRRLWRRDLPVTVVLVHRDEEQADQVIEAVLAAVFAGYRTETDYHRVTAQTATWWEKKGTILGKAMVELPLVVHGGVFVNEEVPLVGSLAPEPDGVEGA